MRTSRMFGGKIYYSLWSEYTKRKAQITANAIRKAGNYARIVEGKHDGKPIYRIYIRKGRNS